MRTYSEIHSSRGQNKDRWRWVKRYPARLSPEEIEDEISKFPEIKECLVFGEESKDDTVISAVVTLDEEYLKDTYGKNIPDLNKIKEIVWEKIKGLNKKMVSYKAVKNLKIRTTDFAKTTTMKIKRFLDSNKKGE